MSTAFQMDDTSFKNKYGFDKPAKRSANCYSLYGWRPILQERSREARIGVKMCLNLTFKVNFLRENSSEPFYFFFIEEHQFRSTFLLLKFFDSINL